MGLVEIKNDRPNLFLRIVGRGYFRGTQRRLMLYFNKLEEAKDKQLYIKAKDVLNNRAFDILKYTIDDLHIENTDGNIPPNTMSCVIDEELNGLEKGKEYWITVGYHGTNISQSKNVLPHGVHPNYDRDVDEKKVQNYLWDGESVPNTWRKWSAVKTKTGYAAAVVIVPCPACGHQPGNENDSL